MFVIVKLIGVGLLKILKLIKIFVDKCCYENFESNIYFLL